MGEQVKLDRVFIMVDENQECYILIRFPNPQSSLYDVRFQNVNPAQIFAAAKILELNGENFFIQGEVQKAQNAQMNKIAIPKGVMPNQLK